MDEQQNKKSFPVWAIILIIACAVILVLIISSSLNNDNSRPTYSGGTETGYGTQSSQTNKKVYGLGETFKFDGLEITLGRTYSFDTVKNQFSDNNGDTVVKLPVTVKNIGNETSSLNMFYYSVFGSKGTEIDTLAAYFDESVDHAGDLRAGASYVKYFYFLYDGNGKYAMEFDNFSEKIEVEFDIKK